METEPEVGAGDIQAGETNPMRIRRRPRRHSSNTSETSRSASYSGGKRNSVLNMLSRIFYPHGNSKDEVRELGVGWMKRETVNKGKGNCTIIVSYFHVIYKWAS